MHQPTNHNVSHPDDRTSVDENFLRVHGTVAVSEVNVLVSE